MVKKHWYFITIFYCPACASDKTYRKRMYTPRPEDWEARHEIIDAYDYCDAF